jgi:serine/threonine-protein kinase
MSEPATVERQLAPGDTIAHFKLLARIGEGGMGVVYEAEDTRLRRQLALKLLHPKVAEDPKRRRRFLREGKLAAQLAHPCIAAVYEVGQEGDRLYIAMELVKGRLLSTLAAERPIPFVEALRIMREVARGLGKAHEIGVVHRDLKPDNVMIGEDGIVKILDFGVAKAVEGSLVDFTDVRTHVGSLVGTPAYMSPEQAAGKDTDARSDIFSVGAVLYELLTGHKPFKGDTWQETIIAINRDTPESVASRRPDLPREINRVVSRCMAKKPADRYASCREVVRELDAVLTRSSLSPDVLSSIVTADRSLPPGSSFATPASTSTRRTLLIAGAVALATLMIGVLAALALSDEPEASPQPTERPSEPTSQPTSQPAPTSQSTSPPAATAEATASAAPSLAPSAPPVRSAWPKASPKSARSANPVLGF